MSKGIPPRFCYTSIAKRLASLAVYWATEKKAYPSVFLAGVQFGIQEARAEIEKYREELKIDKLA